MSGLEAKYFIGRSFRMLLFFLFLGYYCSITFFTHSHVIDGVTIVHSHPFNTDKGIPSSNHPHSGNQLLIIQLLSEFFTTVFAVSFAASVLRFLMYKIPIRATGEGYIESGGFCTYSLRAPPFEMFLSRLRQ